MRLIAKFQDSQRAEEFSLFLKGEGVENTCDFFETSDEEGITAQIWVQSEDDVALAKQWHEDFVANPDDYWFQAGRHKYYGSLMRSTLKSALQPKKEATMAQAPSPQRPKAGILTMLLIAACIGLFVLGEGQRSGGDGSYPLVNKLLMFDYPSSPYHYWQGLYDESLNNFQRGTVEYFQAPMFERVQEGEYWRVFTPVLLHGGLIHILFNLMWLYVLGSQIEARIGFLRFAFLVVMTAIIPNISQYLMGGFQFVGISGVVCGFVMFIYARQQEAPWEGYNLNKQTMNFLILFILGAAGLQCVSYVSEAVNGPTIPIGLANTAHVMGGVVGLFIGKLTAFSWKH